MKKVTTLILMLCLVLWGALCYAGGATGTGNKKGEETILIKQKAHHGGTDKSGSILPSINENVLTVVFSENLGQVSMEVATAAGAMVQSLSVYTPNGVQVYIPNTGNYIVTFTLSNGDVYYGEFTVTN